MKGKEGPGEHTDGKGGAAATIFIWIGIALVLYVLSVGPAVKIHNHASPPVQHLIVILYEPLGLIAEGPLGRPLAWWIDLWRK